MRASGISFDSRRTLTLSRDVVVIVTRPMASCSLDTAATV